MDHDLDKLKSKVAATKGAAPSMLLLLNELADLFGETLKEDGLDDNSQTAKLIVLVRAEAASLAHLAEIGTVDNSVS